MIAVREVDDIERGALAVLDADAVRALLPPGVVEKLLGLRGVVLDLGGRVVGVAVEVREEGGVRLRVALHHVFRHGLTVDSQVDRIADCLVTGDRVARWKGDSAPVRRMRRLDLESLLAFKFLRQRRLHNGSVALAAAQLLSTGVFVLIDSVNDFLQLRGPAVIILAGREDGLVGTQRFELERASSHGLGIEI